MAQISDQQILDWNNGKIIPGDCVVVTGTRTTITYNTHDVEFVNIVLEKTAPNGTASDVPGFLNGANPIICMNDQQPKTFSWLCNINPDINVEYPKYRIKVVSLQPPGVIAYSNYFKISINNIIPEVKLPINI